MTRPLVSPELMALRKFVLLRGAAGVGKTFWARDFSRRQTLWKAAQSAARDVQRLAGVVECGPWQGDPDTHEERQIFRAPHHSVSVAGMAGMLSSGFFPRPGELSLAHGGTLFLDEAGEFSLRVLEAVEGAVARGWVYAETSPHYEEQRLRLPACFSLVVATNLCPCGLRGGAPRDEPRCGCSEARVAAYRERTARFERFCEVVELSWGWRERREASPCSA